MNLNESLNPNGNYPAMTQSQWDAAPFNQSDPEDMDFEITCSQSLSKTVTVTTGDYTPGASGVDYERDADGIMCATHYKDRPDTSDTNWKGEYMRGHLTPLELIKKLRSLLLDIDSDALRMHPCYQHKQYYINECSGWTEDETEFIEN